MTVGDEHDWSTSLTVCVVSTTSNIFFRIALFYTTQTHTHTHTCMQHTCICVHIHAHTCLHGYTHIHIQQQYTDISSLWAKHEGTIIHSVNAINVGDGKVLQSCMLKLHRDKCSVSSAIDRSMNIILFVFLQSAQYIDHMKTQEDPSVFTISMQHHSSV